MKKLINCILSFCLAFVCIVAQPTSEVHATDFEGQEDKYYELCKSNDLSNSDIKVCREFKEYITDKQKELEDKIAENKKKLESLQIELEEVYKLLADVNNSIEEQNDKIAVLDAQILQLEESIEYRDTQIRERMYVIQSMLNTNMYFEFLMGAKSIDDFFSRMASIDELTEYDQDLIRKLTQEKEQVVADRQVLQEEKEKLDELKKQQEDLIDRLSKQIEHAHDEVDDAKEESEAYQEELRKISSSIENALLNNGGFVDGPVSSGGFSCPVQWGIVTAANWRYPSGGLHMGMDIGGNHGSELYAPCDGVVIYYATGCNDRGGYLGNTCNGGAGNYMIMLAQVGGSTYSIRYLHMTNENFLGWRSGQFTTVYRGQVVGHMGNSGSSTGTHLHVDIINLGPVSYAEAARMYARYGSFYGLGSGYTGYNNRCAVKNSYPCRESGSEMFGYRLYQEVGR